MMMIHDLKTAKNC